MAYTSIMNHFFGSYIDIVITTIELLIIIFIITHFQKKIKASQKTEKAIKKASKRQ